jgi:hypothetical protein
MYAGSIKHHNHLKRIIPFAAAALFLPALAMAQGTQNPTSKFYVADVDGEVQLFTGDKINLFKKQSVYDAEGTTVETAPNSIVALVFSNGTGVTFEKDTRVDIKRFGQEPFVPNRTDMDAEPSVSQIVIVLVRGTIGVSTSKLAPGSNMTFQTPSGSINVRGGDVVIQTDNGVTTVSVISGDCTVIAGGVDTGGNSIHGGQQLVITPGTPGSPLQVAVQNIPPGEQALFLSSVTTADSAKKTVYFQATTSAGASATITLFNSSPINSTKTGTTGGITGPTLPQQVIVAVPVVPFNLPLQFDASPNVVSNASGSP